MSIPWLIVDLVGVVVFSVGASLMPWRPLRLMWALLAAWFGGLTVYQLMGGAHP